VDNKKKGGSSVRVVLRKSGYQAALRVSGANFAGVTGLDRDACDMLKLNGAVVNLGQD